MTYQNVIDLVKSTKEIVFSEEKLSEIVAKGYADFVTGVDLAVQTYIQGKLSEMYPDVQFMGEEGEKSKLDFSASCYDSRLCHVGRPYTLYRRQALCITFGESV